MAREAAKHAISLAPDLAEGHAILGSVIQAHDWDWKGALAELERAVELAPNNVDALRAYAGQVGMLGRQEEALALLRKAAALDPLNSTTQRFLGLRCAIYGYYDEAEEALRKALDLNPKSGLVYTFLSAVRLFQGHFEDALEMARKEVLPDFRLLGEILANHALGNTAEAERLLDDYMRLHGEYAAYQIAECHGYRGDRDRAFEWLERAYRQRDPGLGHTATDQLFNSLHDDPRWLPFLKKMGLES